MHFLHRVSPFILTHIQIDIVFLYFKASFCFKLLLFEHKTSTSCKWLARCMKIRHFSSPSLFKLFSSWQIYFCDFFMYIDEYHITPFWKKDQLKWLTIIPICVIHRISPPCDGRWHPTFLRVEHFRSAINKGLFFLFFCLHPVFGWHIKSFCLKQIRSLKM